MDATEARAKSLAASKIVEQVQEIEAKIHKVVARGRLFLQLPQPLPKSVLVVLEGMGYTIPHSDINRGTHIEW